MRLKEDFITQEVDNVQFLVPLGRETFKGIVRSNPTAAFIVDRLKEETTEEQIVDAVFEVFDAPREEIAADVSNILKTLRKIGALVE